LSPVKSLSSHTDSPSPARPALQQVEHRTLREQVTGSVRTALMNGYFQPGQSITVKSISSLLGASVMPAREAMNRLIAEGALELRANRSVIVPVLSRQEFNELAELRADVEGRAAAQAAAGVDAGQIEQLRALDQVMRDAVRSRDVTAFLDANYQFHFLIYRLGATRFVLSIIEQLWVRVGPLIRLSLNESGFVDAGRMHSDVIEGLEAHDGNSVGESVRADILGAAVTIRAVNDAAGSWF
jgi:DNA-binding GntR family transcriptional regulator